MVVIVNFKIILPMDNNNVFVEPFPRELTLHIEMKYVSPYLGPFRIASLVVVLNASSLPLPLTL